MAICVYLDITKAAVTINLKDALKENYQNHKCTCIDTHGNYHDRNLLWLSILQQNQNYYNHTHLDQAYIV